MSVTRQDLGNRASAAFPLEPPPPYPWMIWRDSRLPRLPRGETTSVLVLHGPGGFGKTTALMQLAMRFDGPVLWLDCRRWTDPVSLAQGLVHGMHERGIVDARAGDVMAGNITPGHDALSWELHLLPAITSTLRSSAAAVMLVLDDVPPTSDPRWESLFGVLQANLPPRSLLALSTRDDTPAALRRLRGTGALHEVSAQELAFDLEETGRLLAAVGASTHQAPAVWEQTRGWPFAVALIGGHAERGPAEGAARTGSEVDDYLRQHVLPRLDADDVRLLTRLSVLERIEESRCDAVTGEHGSWLAVRRLARTTGLLTALDRDGGCLHMHPLLRRCLLTDLKGQPAGAWDAAHRAAALACEEAGDVHEAVAHARACRDDRLLAGILWPRTPYLLANGQASQLAGWLNGIGEQRMSDTLELALTGAWLASHAGDMRLADRLRGRANEAAGTAGYAGQHDVALLNASLGGASLAEIGRVTADFIASTAESNPWLTLAYYLQAVSQSLCDDLVGAAGSLQQARRLSRRLGVIEIEARAEAALAETLWSLQQPQAAATHLAAARRLVRQHHIDRIPTAAPIVTASAAGYAREGDLLAARNEAMRALRMTSLIAEAIPWHAVHGRVVLAGVFLAVGDYERAGALLVEADEAALEPSGRAPVLDRGREELRGVLERAGTGPEFAGLTTAELRVLQYLPTHLSIPEIAAELRVSRHTVKTQVMSAYRKLGAHTRTEAIRAAREDGLLPTS